MTTCARILATLGLLLAFAVLCADEPEMLVRRGRAGWVLEWRGKAYRCAVGRGGVAEPGQKREGDGRTPSGVFPLRGLLFRPDRVESQSLPSRLRPRPISREDGWCDDPGDPQYNRPVRLPYAASHEALWRERDALYDLILPIGYNDDPVIPGRGSAIFVHVARLDYAPTAGCVALSKADLMEILSALKPGTRIRIQPE